MYSGQQNPQGYQQYPQQQYQQYPQQQPGYPPQQYQQPPAQPPQPAAPPAPQAPAGPAKDTVVADEFKKYIASITWQVGDHQQYPGQHIIKITPPAGKKLVKGDVKKGQITIRSMGIPAPGTPPSGANSIQVNIDTEEKSGFFGSDKKSYPLWLNADEEVDANMQPSAGLKDKIRNIMTQAKVMVPPPPPSPPPPAAPPAPAPQQQYAQPQPGAPAQAAPQQPPAYQQPPPQAPPQYQYQQPAPQPAYQQPAPQYQQQPAPQYQQQPAPQQYGVAASGYGQKICANPNCRTPNAPNATTCYRCGYQLQ
jgi:hypothetical protein